MSAPTRAKPINHRRRPRQTDRRKSPPEFTPGDDQHSDASMPKLTPKQTQHVIRSYMGKSLLSGAPSPPQHNKQDAAEGGDPPPSPWHAACQMRGVAAPSAKPAPSA